MTNIATAERIYAAGMDMPLGAVGVIPEWSMADRLRKAREAAGFERAYLSQLTGLSLTTVSNYEHGHGNPRKSNLRLWAAVTGVPLEWLETGTAGNGSTTKAPSEDGAAVRPEGFEPPTFWSVAAEPLGMDAYALAAAIVLHAIGVRS